MTEREKAIKDARSDAIDRIMGRHPEARRTEDVIARIVEELPGEMRTLVEVQLDRRPRRVRR